MWLSRLFTKYHSYPVVRDLIFNPIALRTAKTLWCFGRSECSRVKSQHSYRLGHGGQFEKASCGMPSCSKPG